MWHGVGCQIRKQAGHGAAHAQPHISRLRSSFHDSPRYVDAAHLNCASPKVPKWWWCVCVCGRHATFASLAAPITTTQLPRFLNKLNVSPRIGCVWGHELFPDYKSPLVSASLTGSGRRLRRIQGPRGHVEDFGGVLWEQHHRKPIPSARGPGSRRK